MTRRVAAAALAFSFLLAGARPALAHGFGPTYDIPIPLWLYLYGAAAAVVLSFLPLALFSRKERDSAISVSPLRPVSRSCSEKASDFTPAHWRPAPALRRALPRRRDRRPGRLAERLQHRPDVRVDYMVGWLQPLYRFRGEPVAAREPLEGTLRLGRRAGPPARLQGRARARRALSRSSRHLARGGALPGVRLDRERLLGFVRAAQHRPLRPRLLPDHTLRHGLLRQGDLAAPGRCVLGVLRPARQIRPHGSQGEGP